MGEPLVDVIRPRGTNNRRIYPPPPRIGDGQSRGIQLPCFPCCGCSYTVATKLFFFATTVASVRVCAQI